MVAWPRRCWRSPCPKLSPNAGEYVLNRAPGGAYVYDDYRFDARIAPDGHVTFVDKPFRLETRVFGVLSQKYRRPGDRRPALVQAIEQVLRDDPDGRSRRWWKSASNAST